MEGAQFVLAGIKSNPHAVGFVVDAVNLDIPSLGYLDDVLLSSPLAVAGLSLLFLLGHIVFTCYSLKNPAAVSPRCASSHGNTSRFRRHVANLGGATIFSFKAARLLACLALAGLSIKSTILFAEREGIIKWGRLDVWQDGLFAIFTYASALMLGSVIGNAEWSRRLSSHAFYVLLLPWFIYVYRDVWPLITFTLTPIDADEGCLLWAKIVILTFAAAIVPLTMPRQHIPVDPNDVDRDFAPTDTASPLSMMLHSYCDSLVYKANKVAHLKVEELPPLSDTYFAKNLAKRCYEHLDPLQAKQKHHVAYNLIFKVFGKEHVTMGALLVLKAVFSLLAPLGINRLLHYMETGGEGAIVKPWVWILWLLLGPIMHAVCLDGYCYVSTVVFVQAQAILTQLVFDHAMRIRVKSETSPSQPESTPTTAAPTPESGSDFEQGSSHTAESPEETTRGDDAASLAPSATTTKASTSKSAKMASGEGKADLQPKGSSGSNNLVGKLNNLVTTDLAVLQNGQFFMWILFHMPTQAIVSIVILHSMLGWSIYCGFAAMLVLSPVPGYAAKLLSGLQADKMRKSDARVQSVTETMNVIRMIKLFGWEPKMNEQLAEKRGDELKTVRDFKLTQLASNIFSKIIPSVTMVVTYSTYSLIMKGTLSASKVFASMAIFELLQESFSHSFFVTVPVVQAKVSLDRINEFITTTELLDEFTPNGVPAIVPPVEVTDDGTIGIRASSFTWTADNSNDGTLTPGASRRQFTLRIEGDLFFKRGGINLVIGQTGSGKTSLLMALLGEMRYNPIGPNSVVKLPREGGVAYHAQESWVLNDTIRNNILFGAPYDEKRYKAVIDQCCLKADLALFDASDQTEVGEKGLTLSGGQKARVTLARAIYSSTEILLLDDVLAALDVHTAKWIVEKCFRSELLRDRTLILVTHNIVLTSPLADFVVSLSPDGRIVSQGSLSSALAKDERLQAEIDREREAIREAEHAIDQPAEETKAIGDTSKKASGQLIVEEEVALGNISWGAGIFVKLFLSSMQGSSPFIFWTLFATFILSHKVLAQLDIWVLGQWAKTYESHAPSDVSVKFYLTLYSAVILASLTAYSGTYATWVIGSIRASGRLHGLLIQSVLGATMRWLDRTPVARVITRCTQDIASIDGPLVDWFYYALDIGLLMTMKFAAIVLISPLFSIPGIFVVLVGFWFGHVYMRAQLPIKRESSNTLSPVLGHFGAAVAGLVSIRAYGAQDAFRKILYSRLDRYMRTQVPYWNLNRWVGVRSSMLGGVFASSLATYLIYGGGGTDASTTGFSLTMAVGLSGMILWFVRTLNLAQVEGNSVERVQQYLRIDQELKDTKQGEPPAYWPASGDLRVEGLSARYSQDSPKVLHNLSFHIKSGERVGIVGRTGSGKSSLTLSLLRCIITEGNVYYDGLPTDKINLSALRSAITIIPQVPELLSGTLRQNLDPFSQHEDVELNDALRSAGLFSLQNEDDESRLTLDSSITGGGNNLSVGQRQIIALARAIVRQCKLLILDEATSAIDYETDNIIQTSLRSKLSKDVTVLTVAHRLHTIMDADKIMVLDQGHIVEFDTPGELLKNEKGFLRMLVDESGDKEKLSAMADDRTARHI